MLCGKHSTTMQTWIISRLILQEISTTQNQHREEFCAIRKSHVCANKLDVQETDFSLTQLHRSGNNFSWCRLTHGRYSRSHSLGFGDWSISFRTEQDWTTQGRTPRKPVAGYRAKHSQPAPIQAHQRHFNWHWPHSIQHNAFWCWCHVVCLWGQWGGSKWFSKVEVPQWDMYNVPTELLWIGCLTVLIWTPRSKSVTLTPNINSQTSWPKGISRVMSGIICFICSVLAISALFAAPKVSAWSAALRWRKEFRNRKKEKGQVATSSVGCIFLSYVDKFFCRFESDCIKKSGDVWSFWETQ